MVRREPWRQTQPVEQKKPNAWGLYDMHGSVWEWCADWYAQDYYAASPEADPPGPERGLCRVFRGGCWWAGASGCRSAYRGRYRLGIRYGSNGFGFRLARTVS
jgi:formylglycine-generating enzyme